MRPTDETSSGQTVANLGKLTGHNCSGLSRSFHHRKCANLLGLQRPVWTRIKNKKTKKNKDWVFLRKSNKFEELRELKNLSAQRLCVIHRTFLVKAHSIFFLPKFVFFFLPKFLFFFSTKIFFFSTKICVLFFYQNRLVQAN